MKQLIGSILVLASVSFFSFSAKAETCIVEFQAPSHLKSSVRGRLGLKKKTQYREAQLAFYISQIKKSSCYRASLIASECPVGRDDLELQMYREALNTCDVEMRAEAKTKYKDPKKAEDEVGVLFAARTACNEEHDTQLDQLLCQIDLSVEQIQKLNPASVSAKDLQKH